MQRETNGKESLSCGDQRLPKLRMRKGKYWLPNDPCRGDSKNGKIFLIVSENHLSPNPGKRIQHDRSKGVAGHNVRVSKNQPK